MKKPSIHITSMQYPHALLEAWEAGNYSFLVDSEASEFIKRILVQKARCRPGRRFFGEAFIASRMEMADGWYNSYKWLTSKKWLSNDGLEPQFEKPFHAKLLEHFGETAILCLQEGARSLLTEHNRLLLDRGRCPKPVAPDLWLITRDGRHLFIESKLPGDRLKAAQLAGLALIKKYLARNNTVDVSVISLSLEGTVPQDDGKLAAAFERFYNMA